MSFPSAVIHTSYSFHNLSTPPISSHPLILCSLPPLSPVMQTATPPRYVSNYQLLTHSSLVCLLPPLLLTRRLTQVSLGVDKKKEKGSSFTRISSHLSFVQRWWPAHSPTTWAGATAEPALYGYAEQCAAPILPPHDPDVWLRLLHQRCYAGDLADEAAQLSGAMHRRRAPSWHLSDFLQWAHTQRHWLLGSGWWETHTLCFYLLVKFSVITVESAVVLSFLWMY